MPHRVDILKTHTPAFPDRCVECGKDAPGTTQAYSSTVSTWKPLREKAWKNWAFDLPACDGCKGALRRGKWLARVVFGVGIAAALGLMYVAYLVWPSLLDGWTGYVVIFGAIAVPLVIGQAIFTPSIEFSGWDDRLAFEFRDADYAKDFAALNDVRVR